MRYGSLEYLMLTVALATRFLGVDSKVGIYDVIMIKTVLSPQTLDVRDMLPEFLWQI